MPPIKSDVKNIYIEISELLEDKEDLELEFSIIQNQLERYCKSQFPPPPEEKISEEETTYNNISTNEDDIIINLINKRNAIKNEIKTLKRKITHNKWRLSISQKAECEMLAKRREAKLREHRENWSKNHPISLFPENENENENDDDDDYDMID